MGRRVVAVVLVLSAVVEAGGLPARAQEVPPAGSTIESEVLVEAPEPRDVVPLETAGADELPALVTTDDRELPRAEGAPVSTGIDHGGKDLAEVVAEERAANDAAEDVRGFDAVSSVEHVDERSRSGQVFANPDGTSTAVISQVPRFYEADDGEWLAIDTSVVADESGVLRNAGDAWAVRFLPTPAGVEYTTADGDRATFAPIGAADGVQPAKVDGSNDKVIYRDVLPSVDLVYTVTAAGVKEDVILKDRSAAPLVKFAWSGAQLHAADDGGGFSTVTDPGSTGSEDVVAEDEIAVGPLEVRIAGIDGVPEAAAPAIDLRSNGSGVQSIAVGVDAEWFASLPDEAFPVVLDPTVGPAVWQQQAYANGGWVVNPASEIRTGNSLASGDRYWRSLAQWDLTQYQPATNWESQVYSATVYATAQQSTSRPLAIRHADEFGWCGVAYADSEPCTDYMPTLGVQTFGSGTVGFDVTSTIVAYWSSVQSPAFIFSGDEPSGTYTYKSFSVSISITYDRTPKIVEGTRSPANGYQFHSSASGATFSASTTQADPDGQTTYYRFWLCQNPSWTNCDMAPNGDSGITTSNTWVPWTPGPGLTAWFYNKQLYWAVEVMGTATPGSTDLVLRSNWNSWKLYNNSITAPSLVSPADGFTWSPPTSATLTAAPVTEPDGDSLWYRFVVRERGAVGVATRSEWITVGGSNVTWTIPATAPLEPGLSYEWTVEWRDGPTQFHYYYYFGAPQNQSVNVREAIFDERLGSSGPSPFQSIGPFTVNLANSNLTTSISSVSQSTVGGTLGASLVYNSNRKAAGLRAIYSSGSYVVQRVDPTIDFNWGTGGPSPMFPVDFWYAKWTGWITVPATGSYTFGTGLDDNVTVTVNGTQVLNQGCCTNRDAPAADGSYWAAGGQVKNSSGTVVGSYTSISLTAGVPYPIVVDFSEVGGAANVALFVRQPNAAIGVVPTGWLTPDQPILPAGWLLDTGAGQDAEYVSARLESDQLVLSRVDGSVSMYRRSSDGRAFTPEPGEDAQASVLADGRVQVIAADGGVYQFTSDGWLAGC